MTMPHGHHTNFPKNWPAYKEEIHRMLMKECPNYKIKTYITPELYIQAISEKPWNYPLLRVLRKKILKQYIAYFLMEQGRVARGTKAKTSVWMLPEAKNG